MSHSQRRLERKLRRIERHIKDYQEHLRLLEKRRREIRRALKYPSNGEEQHSFLFPLFFKMLFPTEINLPDFKDNLHFLRSALDKALEHLETPSSSSDLNNFSNKNPQEISPQLLQAISQLNPDSLAIKDLEKSLGSLPNKEVLLRILPEILKNQKD